MKELPKVYEPQQVESSIYEMWMENDCFKATPDPDKKPYSIVMPPPNVTGQLHMGHALDATLQDARKKYEILTAHKLPVIVMEPVRGGKLADLGEAHNAQLKALRPDLCANCPEHARTGVSAPDYPLSPVCMSCPWFGYLYGEMCAENWQSPRRRRPPKRTAE